MCIIPLGTQHKKEKKVHACLGDAAVFCFVLFFCIQRKQKNACQDNADDVIGCQRQQRENGVCMSRYC